MKAILFFYVIIYLLLTCSKLEPRQPHKPLYILPSGCYRYPGIPSFPREQELMKNQRTERLSAYDPLCQSYHKKQDRQPCYPGEEYDLYHHQKQQRNKVCQQEHVLTCKYQQLGVGNESG